MEYFIYRKIIYIVCRYLSIKDVFNLRYVFKSKYIKEFCYDTYYWKLNDDNKYLHDLVKCISINGSSDTDSWTNKERLFFEICCELNDYVLPTTLTHLICEDVDISGNELEGLDNLEYLSCESYSAKFISKSIKVLHLQDYSGEDILLPNLKELVISKVNSDIGLLPDGLEVLYIYHHYYKIKHLPNTLIDLDISQTMLTEGVILPLSLIKLKMKCYSHLDFSLYTKLRDLWIYCDGLYNMILPPYVKILNITNITIKGDIPSSLIDLDLMNRNSIPYFPPNLKNLNIYNQHADIMLNGSYNLDLVLPKSLKRIFVNNLYNLTIDPNIEELYINNVSTSLDIIHPKLKVISLPNNWNIPIDLKVIGESLTHINTSVTYNYQIVSLPPNLHYLKLGNTYNLSIDPGILPPSLYELILGRMFNQELKEGVLNEGLTKLYIKGSYSHNILYPPSTLLYLYIPYGDYKRMPFGKSKKIPDCYINTVEEE